MRGIRRKMTLLEDKNLLRVARNAELQQTLED